MNVKELFNNFWGRINRCYVRVYLGETLVYAGYLPEPPTEGDAMFIEGQPGIEYTVVEKGMRWDKVKRESWIALKIQPAES